MTLGIPVPGRVTHPTLALYPLPVRRIRDFVIGFLQIPPRDWHPCLYGWFRSSRSIGDLHPLNATPYSTHQPKPPAHPHPPPSKCRNSRLNNLPPADTHCHTPEVRNDRPPGRKASRRAS